MAHQEGRPTEATRDVSDRPASGITPLATASPYRGVT
jgi:hypothetical protein